MTAPTNPKLPATAGDVTTEWLNSALPDSPHVRNVTWEQVGQGFGLTGVVARLRASVSNEPGVPHLTMMMKLPMALPESTSVYRDAQMRDDAAAGRYSERCAREVSFYREIAPESPEVAPRVYFAATDDHTRTVVLLLEDLGFGRPGDVLSGCGASDASDVVKVIARFHARWWRQSDADARRLPWLPNWGGNYAARQERYISQLPRFLARWGASIPPEITLIAKRLLTCYGALLREIDHSLTSVIHGDLHLDNVIFDIPDRLPPVVLLDWQSVCYGPTVSDIVPFISGSLAPEDRRYHERHLLESYHAELVLGGVSSYPFAQLQRDYVLSLLRRLPGVIGWLSNTDPDKLDGREKE